MNHHEGLPSKKIGQGQEASRGAAGDGFARVMQTHPEPSTITQNFLIGFVGGVDGQRDLLDPARLQQAQHVFHHRTIGHRQERLGHRSYQRHQVRVLPPGENHGLHRWPPQIASGRVGRVAVSSVRPRATP